MGQYKEANERMNNTGDGLEGIEFANFQDYIVNNICKYYFALDPVLKDRPNVRPWVTNETIDILDDDDNTSSSDDESVTSQKSTTSDKERDKLNETLLEQMVSTTNGHDEYNTNDSYCSSTTISTNPNSSTPSTMSSDSSNKNTTRRAKRVQSKVTKEKLSPMEAKNLQKNVIKKKRKSIVKKGKLSKMTNEDEELIVERRNVKIMFEKEKYNYMKTIESEKLKIDKERLKMEMDAMLIKQQQEKSRLVLLRLEMFKERQAIKKEYPEVTEEFLEANFPYPE